VNCMNLFLRIDTNVIAMILLGIVIFLAYHRLDREEEMNKVFLRVSLIIVVELFFETATCMINGKPGTWSYVISNILHICLFVGAPILTYFWYRFIYSWILPEKASYLSFKSFLILPVLVNAVISVLSPFYGFVFSIDPSNNVYHRGSLFILSAVIIYFYIVYCLGLVIKHRKHFIKHEFFPMVILGILPMVGGILQTLFYGVLLMWSSTAFSLVVVYNFLQQRMIHLDELTGAWTRGSFDYYISQRIKYQEKDRFGVIFIDLDGLKRINDEFGHCEGDSAIKTSVELIKAAISKSDILIRFGGDEFLIIVNCDKVEVLKQRIKAIQLSFQNFGKNADQKYLLDCSFGADLYSSKFSSIEQFLHHVDSIMYKNKKAKQQKENFSSWENLTE
jgi:diguanylate cyclase (GGDEF)-like protein